MASRRISLGSKNMRPKSILLGILLALVIAAASSPVLYVKVAIPVTAPSTGGGKLVVDFLNRESQTNLTGDVTFAHATNLVAGVAKFANVYLFAGNTNRLIIFPTNWVLFGCTVTNTALSNQWTALYFKQNGTSQTNVWVKLEVQ